MQRVLIRLPNWLGDMVMSSAFVRAVAQCWPQVEIDLIARQGIHVLLEYFPAHRQRFVFAKSQYGGAVGAWRFGRELAGHRYDAYFSLPDSFSTAVTGFASGARQRIGYRDEWRSALLTHAYDKLRDSHRVEQYLRLLEQFSGAPIATPQVTLHVPGMAPPREELLVININSEASSRRLPVEKAIRVIDALRAATGARIDLVGAPKEASHVQAVIEGLRNRENIINRTGESIAELVTLAARCRVFLSTDSGPAHIANAVGAHTIVLNGAGNEANTAPYNVANRQIIRLGQLPCEPCVKNECRLYGVPKCLTDLDEARIVSAVQAALSVDA